MGVPTGSRLGPYEILAPLGSGGMGEVYRARDTKLNRTVALKVLPSEFALDADRLARFKREAQVLASLDHPNIAAIYGIEDSAGVHALVLQLVEGPTLADRIAEGPISIDEALPIARQIAEALEAAHDQGIIHRDLKPANIKVTAEGTVKVLDFGLAKLLDAETAPSSQIRGYSPGLTNSPTITTPAMTMAGVILGTAAYMSPEQAKGRPADKRSDIWAFGCVLFEMLTGKRAFNGEDVSDTLAVVLRGSPDWPTLPPEAPAAVRTLLRRCLEKDRNRRLAAISAAYFLLSDPEILDLNAHPAPSHAPPVRHRRVLKLIAASTVIVAVTGAIGTRLLYRRSSSQPPVMRLSIVMPGARAISGGNIDRNLAISPDGTHVVYVSGPAQRLMLRAVDRPEAEPLGNIAGARFPFFSPDSNWVGYFAGDGQLKKVAIRGGLPFTICRYTNIPRGATWGPDDTIVFTTNDTASGLLRVTAGGGEPTVLTKPDLTHGELDHVFPSWLPNGRGVLFTIRSQAVNDPGQVAVLELRSGRHHPLITGSQGEYVDSGHLVYVAQDTLRAVRFDLDTLAIAGNAVPIEQVVMKGQFGAVDFAVSRSGTLIYVPPGAVGQIGTPRSLVWVTRQGTEQPISAPPRSYTSLHLSPDDSRIALDIRDQQNNIWLWDVRAQTLTRLTDGSGDQAPVWTHDGLRLIYSSQRDGARALFRQFADGTGMVEKLTATPFAKWPSAVSLDGTRVVVTEVNDKTGDDVAVVWLDGDKRTVPLVTTTSAERSADLSPDGRHLAYQSNEAEQDQIFVRPFPDVNNARWQITTAGGTHPRWAPNGRELFYVDVGGSLNVVPVSTNEGFKWGPPAVMLRTKYFAGVTRGAVYDVTRDGQRFVMIKESDTGNSVPANASFNIVLNWTEELKQRAPTK